MCYIVHKHHIISCYYLCAQEERYSNYGPQDFSGDPAVNTVLPMQGVQVHSLVRELDTRCNWKIRPATTKTRHNKINKY